jgi:hypothetical protein
MPFQAKMTNVSDGEGSASHKTVTGRARPTSLDAQASYPVTQVDLNAGHVGLERRKIVRLVSLDLDRNVSAIELAGKLCENPQQPVDRALAYLVVRDFQRDKIIDVAPTGSACKVEHFGR